MHHHTGHIFQKLGIAVSSFYIRNAHKRAAHPEVVSEAAGHASKVAAQHADTIGPIPFSPGFHVAKRVWKHARKGLRISS